MGTRRRRRASWKESMTWREARRLMRSKIVPPTTSSTTNSHPALSNPSPHLTPTLTQTRSDWNVLLEHYAPRKKIAKSRLIMALVRTATTVPEGPWEAHSALLRRDLQRYNATGEPQRETNNHTQKSVTEARGGKGSVTE
eukprot:1665446-Rhodomonas_salina.1